MTNRERAPFQIASEKARRINVSPCSWPKLNRHRNAPARDTTDSIVGIVSASSDLSAFSMLYCITILHTIFAPEMLLTYFTI